MLDPLGGRGSQIHFVAAQGYLAKQRGGPAERATQRWLYVPFLEPMQAELNQGRRHPLDASGGRLR